MEKRAVWRGRQPLSTLGFIVSLLKLVEQRIICPVEIFTTAPCWLLILCMFIMIYGRISLDKLPCTLVVYFVDKSRGARTYIVRLSWPTTASSNSELWTQPADNVSQPRWNHEEISVPFTLFALAYLSISMTQGGGGACLPPYVCRVWFWVGFKILLEITCLGIIYHFQKELFVRPAIVTCLLLLPFSF